uniref:Uncharacterized protein n=1 Tax=Vitis vinifera TaxID=29760 RepID=A5AQB5_VITVI|nr:hypothetical protein VITISV_010029 [Vitis vinifera]
MGRAPCCDKANVKKGPWSPEEDAKLKTYIEQYGTGGNWIALPQKIAQLPGRTDNDIKNYWNTRLKKKLLGKRKQSHFNRLSVAGQDPKDATGVEDNPYSQALSNSALERLQLHMQLQSLQHPFAFYNNPALWPKLHPLQEKLIQNLQNELPSPLMQHTPPSSDQMGQEQKSGFYEPPTASITLQQEHPKINNPKGDEFDKSLNVLPSSDSSMAYNSENMVGAPIMSKPDGVDQSNIGQQAVSTFQAELDDFLNNKMDGFLPQEEQMTEIYGSKDSLAWWSNDFDTKSASSHSWDSTPVIQSEGMFQDYVLGFGEQKSGTMALHKQLDISRVPDNDG